MTMQHRDHMHAGMRAKTFLSRVDARDALDRGLPIDAPTMDVLAQATSWLEKQKDAGVCLLSMDFDRYEDNKELRERWAQEKSTPESRVLDTIFPKPGDEWWVASVTVYYEVTTDGPPGEPRSEWH